MEVQLPNGLGTTVATSLPKLDDEDVDKLHDSATPLLKAVSLADEAFSKLVGHSPRLQHVRHEFIESPKPSNTLEHQPSADDAFALLTRRRPRLNITKIDLSVSDKEETSSSVDSSPAPVSSTSAPRTPTLVEQSPTAKIEEVKVTIPVAAQNEVAKSERPKSVEAASLPIVAAKSLPTISDTPPSEFSALKNSYTKTAVAPEQLPLPPKPQPVQDIKPGSSKVTAGLPVNSKPAAVTVISKSVAIVPGAPEISKAPDSLTDKEKGELDQAAVKLQSGFRAFKARKEVKELKAQVGKKEKEPPVHQCWAGILYFVGWDGW